MDKNRILEIFNEVVESWVKVEEMHIFERSAMDSDFCELRENIEEARKEFLEVLEGKDDILNPRLEEVERMTKLY